MYRDRSKFNQACESCLSVGDLIVPSGCQCLNTQGRWRREVFQKVKGRLVKSIIPALLSCYLPKLWALRHTSCDLSPLWMDVHILVAWIHHRGREGQKSKRRNGITVVTATRSHNISHFLVWAGRDLVGKSHQGANIESLPLFLSQVQSPCLMKSHQGGEVFVRSREGL